MSIIECTKLTKTYGSTKSLTDVTFRVDGKGCIGFLGSNGAGKTTTIRILTGLASPTTGEVKVCGFDAVTQRPQIRNVIGYVPQSPTFYSYMTAEEWMHWTGQLFGMSKKDTVKRTDELLHECGIYDARTRAIGGFSGGMKQRLGIAQALLNQPKLIIMDEPVSALDPLGRHEVLMLVEKLKSEMTVFMSTHILEDVERVADRVVVINRGEVIIQDTIPGLRAKYTEPTIDFVVEGQPTDKIMSTLSQGWITDIIREGNAYKVTVNDLDAARTALPQLLLETGAVLTAYNVGTSTLEDIFLKVVKS